MSSGDKIFNGISSSVVWLLNNTDILLKVKYEY